MTYTYSREKLLSAEPDEDLIDKLSPSPQCRYVYRWFNGRIGAIFPSAESHLLDFREYKLYDGPDDRICYPSGLRPAKEGDEDSNECCELLAVGIVAYYLCMRNKMNPKDIFADYLEDAIKLHQFYCDADMQAWNPKFKKNFSYSKHFKEEKRNIRISSRIFDFLRKKDITEIKYMTVNYLQFVKSRIKNVSFRNLTRDEEKYCFKTALLRVMNMKNEQGDYIFCKYSHWIAVYRNAVDNLFLIDDNDFGYETNDEGKEEVHGIPSTGQLKAFNSFIQELGLNQKSTIRIPYDHDIDLSKSSYKRYNTSYPWPKEQLERKGLALYNELTIIYNKLNEECRDVEEEKSISLI